MELQVVLMETLYAEGVPLFQPDCCKQAIRPCGHFGF
jgi:hypothetical protein